jgi:hypothetical protein
VQSESICVSIRLVAPKEEVPISSLASHEGGCGVAGWQGLKMDSGDIADLMPCFYKKTLWR